MVEASFAEKLRRRQASLRQSNVRPRGSEEALAAQQLARRQASEYAFQQRMLEQGLGVQGWNDGCGDEGTKEYEANLRNLIHDVRAEFGVANLPVSIGLSGFGGWGQGVDRRLEIMRAQYNVSTYVANVATVETRGFFRDFTETGGCINQGYHWFGNGETYVYVGTAMGAAMKALLAGTWVQPKIDYLPPAGGAVSCASAFACGPYADGEPLCYW